MANEVWAVHHKGVFLNAMSGDRQGAVYNTIGKARAARTRLSGRRFYEDGVHTKLLPEDLEVVRYVPEEKK